MNSEKVKEIEKMAKVIDDRLIEARAWLGSMNRGKGYWIAQKLVENYQPKLPEDSVVLSMEEWECLHTDYAKALYNVRQNAIKETAREILQTLYNYPHEWHEMKIKELAKEYGVEVEE